MVKKSVYIYSIRLNMIHDNYFAICDDTLKCILNYLPTDNIYKLKSLSKQFNDFIDNQFVLTNYYCVKLNKNLIEKYKNNLIKIICVSHDVFDSWNLNDRDLMGFNKLDTLILPLNKNITDEGLKGIPNIRHLNLYRNNNITDEGLKYIPNVQHLDLYFNEKITDEGLKYIPNIQHLMISYNKNITNKGLMYIPNIQHLVLSYNKNITDEGLIYS